MEWLKCLNLGALAAFAGGLSLSGGIVKTMAQNILPEGGWTNVLRIYEDTQGNAHLEELVIADLPGGHSRKIWKIPAINVFLREYTPQVVDWHKAPAHQFAITVVGELEVEVSDGVRHRVHPGELVFLEDTKGKGHKTHLLSSVTNLYIRVPDSFDLLTWTHGMS